MNNSKREKEIKILKEKVIELERKVDVYKESLRKIEEKEKEKEGNSDRDVFLTGNTEMILLSTENEKLKNEIKEMRKEMDNVNKEKSDLCIEIKEVIKDKENFEKMIKFNNATREQLKSELMNIKEVLTKEEEKSKKIEMSLIEKKKNLQSVKKEKFELEEIIFKQEAKVANLLLKINKIVTIIKEKNKKIKENEQYIAQLEEMLRELNNEFKILKRRSNSSNKNEIIQLKNKVDDLMKENEILKRKYDLELKYKKSYRFSKGNINEMNRGCDSMSNLKGVGLEVVDGIRSLEKYGSNSLSKNLFIKELKKINGASFKIKNKQKNIINRLHFDGEDNLFKTLNNIKNNSRIGGKFYNININNNYKPVSLVNTDFLLDKQEKEKIDEFKTIINKLISDIDK